MNKKSSYNYEDLINCGNGGLFGPGNAKLPLPPMLMFDRITNIEEDGGTFKKGIIEAIVKLTKTLFEYFKFFIKTFKLRFIII